MTSDDLRQSLAVLACDLEERPRGAPGILDVASAIQQVIRDEGVLIVSFAATVTRELEAFVAAEQQCCAEISWNLHQAGAQTRLKVVATAEQLDQLEMLFTQVRPPSEVQQDCC